MKKISFMFSQCFAIAMKNSQNAFDRKCKIIFRLNMQIPLTIVASEIKGTLVSTTTIYSSTVSQGPFQATLGILGSENFH